MWIPSPPSDSTGLSTALDLIDKITKILALLIGGMWAYLNYVRGRTFKRRLEPSITGKTILSKGVLFLSGLAEVKNVGLSKVPIEQKGTAVEVLALKLRNDDADAPELHTEDVDVRSVFKRHGWLEPGEHIQESFFLPVPEKSHLVALRLRLRIVADGIEWNADSVVELKAEDEVGWAFGDLCASRNSYASLPSQDKEDDTRTSAIEDRKKPKA
jgi:hypothetical protein